MALQAKRVYIAYPEKPRIRGTVRRMAAYAPFGLHHRMFIYKRAGRFRMAFRANCVLIGCGAKLRTLKRPMRIVAVSALHQPLGHLVMEWLREGQLHIRMTRFAEPRLRDLEMVLLVLKLVGAMAVDTTQARLRVVRMGEVGVYRRVALEACRIDLLFGSRGKSKNFSRIAAGVDMSFSGPMAALARLSGTVREGGLCVRGDRILCHV